MFDGEWIRILENIANWKTFMPHTLLVDAIRQNRPQLYPLFTQTGYAVTALENMLHMQAFRDAETHISLLLSEMSCGIKLCRVVLATRLFGLLPGKVLGKAKRHNLRKMVRLL
ncbi:MAG: hypothetical protein K8L97_01320 [Anaerolineae bacterium]|nr:hypothetical protein [Anaerolineae bacterium]